MKEQTFQSDLFKDRVVLVTGGTSGIGKRTAELFAELGAKVHACGLGSQQVEFNPSLNVKVAELDVTDEDAVRDYMAQFDTLDVLFNCAGTFLPDQYNFEYFKKMLDINLNSVFLVSELARPMLAQSEIGNIINVSSITADFGSAYGPAYAASKGGVDQITKSLAIEYGTEIRVNAVRPGFIVTGIFSDNSDHSKDPMIERTPLARLGDPDDIAQVVVFLASPAAKFIDGEIITIDGGYSVV